MKKLLLALLLLTLPLAAQERIDLSVPIPQTNTGYTLESLSLNWTAGTIAVTLKSTTGDPLTCAYTPQTTPTGSSLIVGLNKANLSTAYAGNATTGSLKFRICHRLIVMGESQMACGVAITGSCQGTVP